MTTWKTRPNMAMVALCIAASTVACNGDDAPFGEDDDTTSSSSSESGTSGAEPPVSSDSDESSTAAVDTSESSDTAADSSTGDPEPVVTCMEQACQRSCTYPSELDHGEGEVCECISGTYAEDHVACELPLVCGEQGYLCHMQALRYGIAGRFTVMASLESEGYLESAIEIFGDGRARALTYTQMHTCCSGVSVDTTQVEGLPVTTSAIDDPVWQSCFASIPDENGGADELPACYEQVMFGTGACDGPLQVCPEIEAHVPGCDADCPMADDGVCDDPSGTGLCADGCDPVDCACPGDLPDTCDEISAENGTCPLGSDADDCPG